MVLAELGSSITKALSNITKAVVVNDEAINEMLKEISTALILADVNIRLVAQLKDNIKKQLSFETPGINKRNYIRKVYLNQSFSSC